MKKLITLFVVLASMNIAVASELGESQSADCTSLVQSNRSADVVTGSSVQVEVEESSQR